MYKIAILIFAYAFHFSLYANVSSDNSIDELIKIQKKLDSEQAGRSDFIEAIKDRTSLVEYEIKSLNEIVSNASNYETVAKELNSLRLYVSDKKNAFEKGRVQQRLKRVREAKVITDKKISEIKSEINKDDLGERLKLLKKSLKDNKDRDNQIKSKLRTNYNEKNAYLMELREKVSQLAMSSDDLAIKRVKEAVAQRRMEKKESELAQRKADLIAQEKAFVKLGQCYVGNTVYHREVWNTKTSSGNVIADGLFGAATKETFIITYEAIVESFLGDKVKTTINDYKIQQTVGGGFLDQKTYRKYNLGSHADKYIGKVQFYSKSRCD
jgi:chromosome segregation ATPase